MAYFAKLDENNLVLEVHSVANEALDSTDEENSGIAFLTDLLGYSNWKQTSYNAATNGFRFNYAGIGYHWDGTGFYPPQPYPSWTLDEGYQWQPPTPMPIDGKRYQWDEDELSWKEIAAL